MIQEITKIDTIAGKKAVATQVLEDTNRTDLYDINDLEQVEIYYGNVMGNEEKDVVIMVSFGSRNTIVALYEAKGLMYEYVGEVGNFYEVQNIEFIPIASKGKDMILIDEFANQSVGAYEVTEFLKGFLYEDEEFKSIFTSTTDIETIWNQAWESEESEALWKRITENTQRNWSNDYENLDMMRYQTYYTSPEEDPFNIPKRNTFEKKDSRMVMEKYEWSADWERFIIGEAIEKATGQTVALIADRDNEPYILAGYEENAYEIQRRDGSVELIHETELLWNDGNEIDMKIK